MGSTKTEQYTAEQLDFSRIGKAISAPARVAIIQYLNHNQFATNKELINHLHLSESTVHQHLEFLKKMQFVEGCFFHHKHVYVLREEARKDLTKVELILE